MNQFNIIKKFEKFIDISDENDQIFDDNAVKCPDSTLDVTRRQFSDDLVKLVEINSTEDGLVDKTIEEILQKYPNHLDDITQIMIAAVDRMKREFKEQFEDTIRENFQIEKNIVNLKKEHSMIKEGKPSENIDEYKKKLNDHPQFKEIKDRIDQLVKIKRRYDDLMEQISIKNELEILWSFIIIITIILYYLKK